MKKALFLSLMLTVNMIGYTQNMNVLTNIQTKISQDTPVDSLRLLANELDQLDTKTKNSYVRYWKAYAYYRIAVRGFKDGDDTEQLIDKGIETLEKIDNKNSDQYALLSLFRGLALNFTNSMAIPFKAKAIEKDAQKAIDLDKANCRAYFAMGYYDLYVPKAFGGRKICESMFKKALSLPDVSDPNPYAPDWGHRDTYRQLIGYYMKEEKPDQAIFYIKEGYAKYPKSGYLKEMYAKLVKN